jgi:hypothetical protein
MSKVSGTAIQVGDSGTATQNLSITSNVDGTFTIARGNLGATTQDIFTIDANGVIGFSNSGVAVQEVNIKDGEVATGATAMVYDDTIPQNTEGDEYMSLSITPKSATNTLNIVVSGAFSNSVASNFFFLALFKDSTVDALTAVAGTNSQLDAMASTFTLTYSMVAGTTSPVAFKLRAGGASGTTTFNGVAGVRRFGGVYDSSITITEVTP